MFQHTLLSEAELQISGSDNTKSSVIYFLFYITSGWPIISFILCFIKKKKKNTGHCIIILISTGTTGLIITNKMYQHLWCLEYEIVLYAMITNRNICNYNCLFLKNTLTISPAYLNYFGSIMPV